MPTLQRLESATPDPTVGGVLVTFEQANGEPKVKVCSWSSRVPVDVPATARAMAERLIDWAMRESPDALRDTNWVSLTSGLCLHVAEWNRALGPGI